MYKLLWLQKTPLSITKPPNKPSELFTSVQISVNTLDLKSQVISLLTNKLENVKSGLQQTDFDAA